MIGYYHIIPRSPAALDIVAFHGSVMGVDKQDHTEVLLWCATPTCSCWQKRRYRAWFRLGYDVQLGSPVRQQTTQEVQDELNSATSAR